MNKQIRHLFFWAFILAGCQSPVDDTFTAAGKPNILFIFADDMTYEAIGALGNDVIRTPNLDRLVQDGTTFTHAYNMGGWNGAVCVASRSMLISGRYLWRAQKMAGKWQKSDLIARDHTRGIVKET